MGAGKTLPLEPRLIIISNPTKTDTLYDTKHRIMVTTTPSFSVFMAKKPKKGERKTRLVGGFLNLTYIA